MPKKITTQVGIAGNLSPREFEIPDNEPLPWGPEVKTTLVGGNHTQLDGVAKVTGAAKYSFDINLPGMLYGKILRSPHPAAKITKIDTSAAEKMPGVRAVMKVDIPMGIVRYAGWEIAAVAADTMERAIDAMRAIKVTYEVKPHVVQLARAMREDSPQVHEAPVAQKRTEADDAPATRGGPVRKGNLNIQPIINTGDVAKGFADADVVIEATYATEVQTHSALETHGGVCKWDGDDLTVYASTQGVFSVRDGMSDALKIPRNKVRVITEYMGGGFGAKLGTGPELVICAKLAKQAGVPVKLLLDRMEEQLCTGNRPSSMMEMKFGCKKDGALTAMQLSSYGSGGITGGSDTRRAFQRIYSCPNTKFEAADVFLNSGPASAQRAPGHPPGVFGLDSMMDMLADKIGMDPLEFRKKNDHNVVRNAEYEIGASEIGWARRNKVAGGGPSVNGKKRGIGMAAAVWSAPGGNASKVDIDINRDGTVEVRQGVQDIGTGTRTMVGIVVAEELGIPLDWVVVKIGDSNWGVAPGSGGSNTAPTITPAVRAAAFDARNKLTALAAEMFKVPADQVEMAGAKFTVKGDASKSASWKQVCSRIVGSQLSATGSRARNWDTWISTAKDVLPVTNAGVQFADVEVDTQTGQVRVIKVVAVHDAGRVINRLTCESQVIGGVIQSLGYALMENRILDRVTGRMVNPDLEFYKIPCAEDVPEIVPIMFEAYFGQSNTDVIGLGEPPKVPGAGAIGNAIYNAIGARIYSTPFTPDKVLAALSPNRTAEDRLPVHFQELLAEVRKGRPTNA